MYTATLAPLGRLRLVYDSGPRRLTADAGGYGPDAAHELLNIFVHGDQAHAPGQGAHVAAALGSGGVWATASPDCGGTMGTDILCSLCGLSRRVEEAGGPSVLRKGVHTM